MISMHKGKQISPVHFKQEQDRTYQQHNWKTPHVKTHIMETLKLVEILNNDWNSWKMMYQKVAQVTRE